MVGTAAPTAAMESDVEVEVEAAVPRLIR